MDDGSLAGELKRMGDRIADLQRRVQGLEAEACQRRSMTLESGPCPCRTPVLMSHPCRVFVGAGGTCHVAPPMGEPCPEIPVPRGGWEKGKQVMPADGTVAVLVFCDPQRVFIAKARDGRWRDGDDSCFGWPDWWLEIPKLPP